MERERLTEKLKDYYDHFSSIADQFPMDLARQGSGYQQAFADLQILFEELRQHEDDLIAAQDTIEAERQRYYLLFDYSPDRLGVTDVRGRILQANHAAAYMLGVDVNHLVGKPFSFYIDQLYKPKICGQYVNLAKLDISTFIHVDEGEIMIRPRGAEPFWAYLSLSARPYEQAMNKDRNITVFWTFHDISQLKQAQEEPQKACDDLETRVAERTRELVEANQALQATMVELKRRNKELQEFAFAASHDLQEPLRKISKSGELVMAYADEDLDKESTDYVRRMVHAAERMESMISGLLEYSRVSSQNQPFALMDLNAVAQEVLSDLDISRSRVKGQIKVKPHPTISANAVQMRQLLQNQIANGVKFHQDSVPPKVEVWCELLVDGYPEQAPAGKVKDANWIELYVRDNGIGFEEQYLERMLQPFERPHGTGEYEGMGMGLAICRKIVERHGGKITARSASGKGSIFIVTLPNKTGVALAYG